LSLVSRGRRISHSCSKTFFTAKPWCTPVCVPEFHPLAGPCRASIRYVSRLVFWSPVSSRPCSSLFFWGFVSCYYRPDDGLLPAFHSFGLRKAISTLEFLEGTHRVRPTSPPQIRLCLWLLLLVSKCVSLLPPALTVSRRAPVVLSPLYYHYRPGNTLPFAVRWSHVVSWEPGSLFYSESGSNLSTPTHTYFAFPAICANHPPSPQNTDLGTL